MSPWLSHVLMHQKGLKKAQLVACLHCNYVAGILCFRVSWAAWGGPGKNLLSLMYDLACGSLFCPREVGDWPQLDVGCGQGVLGSLLELWPLKCWLCLAHVPGIKLISRLG